MFGLPVNSKLQVGTNEDYLIFCPACNCIHRISRYRYGFNGNLVQITFLGSIKIVGPNYICHFRITDNNIIYFGDSTHGLRGTTQLLPDIP